MNTQPNNLPARLREKGRFCCWKYEQRDGSDKPTKVPYNPRTGGKAQSTNPDTFASLDTALRAAQQGQFDGIGVGIFDNVCAIDVDHCVDEYGKLSDLALDVANTMGTYTEYSPSGRGLRILFTVPEGFQYNKSLYYINNQQAGLEVYIAGSTNKYVTVTGNTLTPNLNMEERNEALAIVLEKYMKRPQRPIPAPPIATGPVDMDDAALLEKAKSSKSFSTLWNGDIVGYKSHSEADIALCMMLSFWTHRDAARIDKLFRQSKLMRKKWDEQRGSSTYGAITIQEAISKTIEVYDPNAYYQRENERITQLIQDCATSEQALKPKLVRACDVPYEPPRWTIAPYLQRGKGTLVQGDNGTGKTAFVCAVAAHISTGRDLMDIPIEQSGDVLVLSVEDDLPVLRGRIEASGGDLTKCHFLTNAAGLNFNSPEVEDAVKQTKARLVIFDPIQAFLGSGLDMFRANETRPALARLFEMCDRNDTACIIIAHTAKSASEKSPVNRALGSVDIPAAMRSIIQVIENPDNEHERIAVHVKCSNAPRGQSIAYTIGNRGGVQWTGFSSMTADDLTAVVKRKEKGVPYENEPLVQVFNQLVTDRPGGGFWSYADLKSEGAKILGFPPFYSAAELKQKLDSVLVKEIQEHDGLIVTCGTKQGGVRGVRIEQYQHPQGYQTRIHN